MKNYKENSRRNFDKQAKVYDNSIYSMYPRKCYKSVIDEINNIMFNKLIDIGCGTGEILNRIANDKDKYYGLDLSSKMLEIAKKKNNSKNITYINGDSEKIPFKDNYFDLITCVESFHHYPNPNNVSKEFNRILKKNGYVIICDMYRKQPLRFFYNILMKVVNTGDVKIYTIKEIKSIFESNGFKEINSCYPTHQTFMCIFKKE